MRRPLVQTANAESLVQTANDAGASGCAQAVCKESGAATATRSGGLEGIACGGAGRKDAGGLRLLHLPLRSPSCEA
ncbi:MAG: hypothetical protein J2P36_09540 [Ktedonobacteraceae bacterium]|nr:hypothetical protein [Ktedonobacteraceae bacterium]